MFSKTQGIFFRKSWLDIFPFLAALICGGLLVFMAGEPFSSSKADALARIVMVGGIIWWASNTVSHIHLHSNLFKQAWLNTGFGLYLTLLTSIPQSLWRFRHLQHHAPNQTRKFNYFRFTFCFEVVALFGLWVGMGVYATPLIYIVYFPGFLLGLGLCQIQGYFEHHLHGMTVPQGTSYYNPAYNFLFFNDGYHVEHHLMPNTHWSQHRRRIFNTGQNFNGAYPPILAWLDTLHLVLNKLQAYCLIHLENKIFRFPKLQYYVIASHKRAVAILMHRYQVPAPSKICVVGGGGFPRTVLFLRELYPMAQITVVDKSLVNLNIAKKFLEAQNHSLTYIQFCNGISTSIRLTHFDLVSIPLGFSGHKSSLLASPGTHSNTVYLMHDWIWRMGERSARVSWWLFKRINLYRAKPIP